MNKHLALLSMSAQEVLFEHKDSRPYDQAWVVNFWVNNTIKYKRDLTNKYGIKDNWQFPEETLRILTGDCEDIAILKGSFLTMLGHTPNILLAHRHALLALELTTSKWIFFKQTNTYILDNAFPHILPLEDTNYVPYLSLTMEQAYQRCRRDGTYQEIQA